MGNGIDLANLFFSEKIVRGVPGHVCASNLGPCRVRRALVARQLRRRRGQAHVHGRLLKESASAEERRSPSGRIEPYSGDPDMETTIIANAASVVAVIVAVWRITENLRSDLGSRLDRVEKTLSSRIDRLNERLDRHLEGHP